MGAIDHFSQGFFRCPDSAQIHYEFGGHSQVGHPVLVFCYGMMCSDLHWSHQVRHFRRRYAVLTLDYRGHQKSPAPHDLTTLNLPQFAQDTAQLLEHLAIERAVVIGHSMGVNVALEIARRFPQKIAGLVLANGTLRYPFQISTFHQLIYQSFRTLAAMYRRAPRHVQALYRSRLQTRFLYWGSRLMGFNPFLTPHGDIQEYVNHLRDANLSVLFGVVDAYAGYDGTACLPQITAPTLIIEGGQDRLIPLACGRLMHEGIKDSELRTVPRGSHCTPLDLPEVVNDLIQEFIERRVR